MINLHGIDKLTLAVFVPLFESSTLTKAVLNQVDVLRVDRDRLPRARAFRSQIWNVLIKSNSIGSRNELYKCLACMALVQQGKAVDEKLLDNFGNRGRRRFARISIVNPAVSELPVPTIDGLNDLEDRLIRILRSDQQRDALLFRYGDLCALDTIQVDLAPEKRGRTGFVRASISNARFSSGVIIRYFEYEVTSMVTTFAFPSLLFFVLF